jgi:hypothetical protein
VENLPVLNQIKAGRAIPITFGLGGDRGLGVVASGWPKSVSVSTSPIEAIDPTVSPGAATLSHDPVSGRYQYVWKTPKTWAGTCRQFTLRLADGTDHHLLFRFT